MLYQIDFLRHESNYSKSQEVSHREWRTKRGVTIEVRVTSLVGGISPNIKKTLTGFSAPFPAQQKCGKPRTKAKNKSSSAGFEPTRPKPYDIL
jgi:hypothetical protein